MHRNYIPSVALQGRKELRKGHNSVNLVLALICTHILEHCPKIKSLIDIFQYKGTAVLSQVGFLSAVEEGFQLLETHLITQTDSPFESGSVMAKLSSTCRSLVTLPSLLESSHRVGYKHCIFLKCDFHGETSFYASDLFCMQCDVRRFS